MVQAALISALLLMAVGPALWDQLRTRVGLDPEVRHEIISATSFCFNGLVTMLVARGVFGPGRVNTHRVLGAVLVYLNVAMLFAIAFDLLETGIVGAIRHASGALIDREHSQRFAELCYFSLSTITSTGFGDFVPVHPLARSFCNLEAVFGQLFPPIFLSRLVALHLVHRRQA
jgi:hypothetical protein